MWPCHACLCTDKKENLIFLIYKIIPNGAVAKSYVTTGRLIYGKIFAHFHPYISMPFLMYDFATAPLWISLYMRKIFSEFPYMWGKFSFSFLSVWRVVGLHNARSLTHHWQTHMAGRLTWPMPQQTILLYTQLQYQNGTGGSYEEKPAVTQTSIRLSNSLVIWINIRAFCSIHIYYLHCKSGETEGERDGWDRGSAL